MTHHYDSLRVTSYMLGLDPRHEHPSWKRKVKVEQRANQQPPNKIRKLEAAAKEKKHAVSRAKGLAKPLPSSNKGFAMLMKMGFKAGDGLGKMVRNVNFGVEED